MGGHPGVLCLDQTRWTALSCVQFLRQAVAHYNGLGVRTDRVMTDNGAGDKKTFRLACEALGLRQIRTRPYTPTTNGKAERFVQTSLREGAYALPYESSAQREAALQPFSDRFKLAQGPHSALNHKPCITRIAGVNNPVRFNS